MKKTFEEYNKEIKEAFAKINADSSASELVDNAQKFIKISKEYYNEPKTDLSIGTNKLITGLTTVLISDKKRADEMKELLKGWSFKSKTNPFVYYYIKSVIRFMDDTVYAKCIRITDHGYDFEVFDSEDVFPYTVIFDSVISKEEFAEKLEKCKEFVNKIEI